MSKCDLMIRLREADATFRGGDVVRGEVVVRVNAPCTCTALTLAHEWRTHGRGNRASRETRKLTLFGGEWSPGEHHRYPFEVPLPEGPSTYHGHLLNIDHYLKARADIPWAIDPKAETELLVAPPKDGAYDFGPKHAPAPEKLRASMKQRGCLLVFGGIFGGIGLVMALVMAGIALSGEEGACGGAAFALVFVLVGAALFLGGLWQGLAQKKLGVPDVRISRSRVARGDKVTVGIVLKPRAEVELESIHVDLVGREVVVSGSGTNRSTHRHTLHERRFALLRDPLRLPAGEPAEYGAEVDIPRDAPFTFGAEDNTLEWILTLRVSVPKWPDWTQAYPLTIGPRKD